MSEVKIDKRTQVLETALELFTTQGLQQTSMAQISKESGVAVGTIYLNFKSKDELIEGGYLYIKEKYGQEILLSEEELNLSFEEQFKCIGKRTYEFYVNNKNYFFFIESCNYSPIISDKVRKESEAHYTQAISILMNGVEKGYIKRIDFALLFQLVYNSIISLVQLKLNGKTKVDDEMINDTFDILLKGLKN